jgi:hypothetical protein
MSLQLLEKTTWNLGKPTLSQPMRGPETLLMCLGFYPSFRHVRDSTTRGRPRRVD